MTSRFLPLLLAGTLISGLPAPALAEDIDLELMGDGSDTNNRDLLRGAYECGFECPAGLAPSEPFDPPFDIDWSVALRGSYIQENTTSRFETALVPALTLSHEGLRTTFDLDFSTEIVKSSDSIARIGALRFSAAGEYGLDEVTNFATDGELTISQSPASDPSNPTDTAISPRVLDGDFAATVTRDIGIAYIGLRGTVGRTDYGDTTLVNATVIDNSADSNTRYGGGLRVSHGLTPIIAAFADASVEYRVYDAASPTLLVKLDSTDYTAKAGLSAEIGTIIEAEGSVGFVLRRFADASLGDVQATLFEGSVTFRPDETLSFIGDFETTVDAPGPTGLGTAYVTRAASGEARYKVNSGWSVWGRAGWEQSTAVADVDSETIYSIGAGSEYLLNAHVALTADYVYSHREATAVTPIDTHKATVGVKVSR